MAIVNILAEKSDFIGLQCWLKLLCVNYQIAPWDFVGIVACYFSVRLLTLPRASSLSLRLPSAHLLCALCSCFWEFVTFKSVLSLSPIIMAQTEICMRNLRLSEEKKRKERKREKKKKKKEEEWEREREKKKAERKGKRNMTAEAQWVGGERQCVVSWFALYLQV